MGLLSWVLGMGMGTGMLPGIPTELEQIPRHRACCHGWDGDLGVWGPLGTPGHPMAGLGCPKGALDLAAGPGEAARPGRRCWEVLIFVNRPLISRSGPPAGAAPGAPEHQRPLPRTGRDWWGWTLLPFCTSNPHFILGDTGGAGPCPRNFHIVLGETGGADPTPSLHQ